MGMGILIIGGCSWSKKQKDGFVVVKKKKLLLWTCYCSIASIIVNNYIVCEQIYNNMIILFYQFCAFTLHMQSNRQDTGVIYKSEICVCVCVCETTLHWNQSSPFFQVLWGAWQLLWPCSEPQCLSVDFRQSLHKHLWLQLQWEQQDNHMSVWVHELSQ